MPLKLADATEGWPVTEARQSKSDSTSGTDLPLLLSKSNILCMIHVKHGQNDASPFPPAARLMLAG